MNTAHWHLVLNHLPIAGTIFSVLLLSAGILFKNQPVKNAGLGFFILTALFAIPVLLTGEGAEDVLESIGQKNEFFIHQHEEQAEIAFWLSESIAVLSIAAFSGWYFKKKYARVLMITVLFAGLINSYLMIKAGNSGGQIRHTEIRSANAIQNEQEEEDDEH